MKSILTVICILLANHIYAAPKVGNVLKTVIVKGDDGGKVSGGKWNSDNDLGGTLSIMFYVDPDEKDTNEELSAAIKKKKFPKEKMKSFGFVNMAATWLPNVIISEILKGKQKKYPDTIMVRDKNRVIVKNWDFADDSSVVAIFDKSKKLIWYKAGAHSKDEIDKVLSLIESNL